MAEKYMLTDKNGNYFKRNSVKNIIGIRAILLTLVLFVLTLSFLSVITAASSYVRSAPAYTFGHQTAPYRDGQFFPTFDRSMCQAGQDFILQIDPLGCTPSVVRSDLLEEQEVTIFCPISATKLNPLIEIKDIDYMIITSKDLPKEVLTVGYYPARAALGKWNPDIKTPFLGNIGYATIVLRRQPNESAMPDFVQGNVTAKLVYDIDNAFGTGRVVYYLPQLSDEEWNENYVAYGFWDGRGYLRLEGADNKGATIGVYSDRDQTGTGRLGEKTRIANLNLEKGGKSREVFLPGFNYCMGGLEIKLEDLKNPDTMARLRIDSEVLELGKEEKFLENRCEIKKIEKRGINQKVEISCKEDERGTNFKGNGFTLRLNPKISLSIEGNTKDYGVGDFLYQDGKNAVYLGFMGNSGKTNLREDLYIRIILIPGVTDKTKKSLSETELSSISDYDKNQKGRDIKEKAFAEIHDIKSFLDSIKSTTPLNLLPATANFLSGKPYGHLHYSAGSDTKLFGKNIDIMGYAGVQDADLSGMSKEVTENYEKAIADYNTIKESLSSERYPPNDVKTLGEQALENAIRLAESLGQRRTALGLCKEFSENYGSSVASTITICGDDYLLSNTQISGQSAVINGRTHIIAFEEAREPTFDEFGLKIAVTNPSGIATEYDLSKNEILYLDDSTKEYIQLISLEEDFATIKTSLKRADDATRRLTRPLTSTNQRLKIGEDETFGSSYSFSIRKINLEKVAKVTINPQIDYARTNATINFKIGIEKRAIKLSPEKTKERIEAFNSTIEKWAKISNGLGKVVTAGKTACLATAGALTIKNFFLNLGGKGIARQTVMKAPGVGWYDKCSGMIKPKGPYENLDACLFDKSPEIDASVEKYEAVMKQQNDEIKKLEEGISGTRFLGEKVVDTDKLAGKLMGDDFKTEVRTNLQGRFLGVSGNNILVGNKPIDITNEIIPYINENTITISQARALQLNSKLLSSSDPNVQEIAKSNVEKILGEIYSNSQASIQKINFETESQTDINNPQADVYYSRNSKEGTYKGSTARSGNKLGISEGVPVQLIVFNNQKYTLELDKNNEQSYRIKNIYDESGKKLETKDTNFLEITRLVSEFKVYDAATYRNAYTKPEAKYYETDPYKGFPSIVPFDTKNGWYAAVKSNVPLLGGLRAYGDSGRVSSFYVCNVGQNGKEENIGGDDICRGFVPGAGQPPDFPGLDERESKEKMDQAVDAISQAQKQYKAGISKITISIKGKGQKIDVGAPAADIPAIQCQDFMSPSDCNLMFNVCDPVICPSSRCNLGGAYPVKDVIQSGIAGSIALCLPNWPEVKVPICVSGVHAGLEGYRSVLSSYQQCLQTSLDTGQTVGICDELNSIYMCEFFWRQGLPLVKYAIPKVVGSVLGQNVRGGGEYLGVSDAWSNAEKSIDYFSQYYASNSFAAFKARSLESAGGEICRNWVSLTGPKGNLFDALVAPDSPVQFYGRFEEILYTTATNPPASQYKVFYHIYAGKDLPAYYQVYLRGTSGSFYQDTDFRRPVATGFIKAGDFKSETVDFTAPSGYKEMCIVVNGQEVCGFKQVTTDFGVNYLSEKYSAQQAKQNASSEAECVSGSPSAFSFLNPNIQAGAEEALNPAIYNRGIIRVCSTENPGKTSDFAIGTESSRWKNVGNCGSQNLKCWLDTNSVNNVIKNANIRNQTLGEVEDNVIDALKKKGFYEDFDALKKELDEIPGQDSAIIDKINTKAGKNIEKIYRNNQKAYLYLKRGNAYGILAEIAHRIEIDKLKTQETKPVTTGEQPTTNEQCISKFDRNGDFLITEDEDCSPLIESLDPLDKAKAAECLSCIEQPEEITPPEEISSTCSTLESCQKVLGEKIIKLAQQKKQGNDIVSDDNVKADTGANSFECLALQVAMTESSIRHCIKSQENENPLYCDGIQGSVFGGDAESGGSFGVMQINNAAHPDAFQSSPSVYDFEENVNYGLDLLIKGYNSIPNPYSCHMPLGYPSFGRLTLGSNRLPTEIFEKVFYSGWKHSIRNYNGWNSQCWCYTDSENKCIKTKTNSAKVNGNPNYVDDVIAARDDVAKLFSECA